MNHGKLTQTQRLTFAAMLLALAIISTLVFKSISLPVMTAFPLLRFSLTPALIVYASLTLGPLYGAIIGAASDLIPALVLSTGPYNVLITIVYAIMGILPWFLVKLTRRFRSALRQPYFFYVTLALILVMVSTIIFATDWLNRSFGTTSLNVKILVVVVLALLSIGLSIGLYFTNRFYQKRILENTDVPSPNEIALISLVVEVVVNDGLKALAFWLFYSFMANTGFAVPFSWAFGMLLLGSPLNILFIVFLDSWLLIYTKKFICSYGYSDSVVKTIEPHFQKKAPSDSLASKNNNVVLEDEDIAEEKAQKRSKIGWIIFFVISILAMILCLIVIKMAQNGVFGAATFSCLATHFSAFI
jgi:ECF transporter S component (folate family)